MFSIYFKLGWRHITDVMGYDHILFLVALCALYQLMEWKKVLLLVTAFTIGHSITLALSALDIFTLNADLIEFLIPVTILLTALYNVASFKDSRTSRNRDSLFSQVGFKYGIALFFGLIHGMGFSNYFKGLLGKESDITLPLFAFNVGIEMGQILIVAFILVASFLAMNVGNVRQKSWNLFVSGAAAGISTILIIEKWPAFKGLF